MADERPPPRFITPAASPRIRAEYEHCSAIERPKLVETISWAAGNGDRSENGDYIYGRKRLREIDRRLAYLAKVMKEAKVVDPAAQAEPRRGPLRRDRRAGRRGGRAPHPDPGRRGRGRRHRRAGSAGTRRSPARCVGARVGDERIVRLPAGEKSYEVIAISYPDG